MITPSVAQNVEITKFILIGAYNITNLMRQQLYKREWATDLDETIKILMRLLLAMLCLKWMIPQPCPENTVLLKYRLKFIHKTSAEFISYCKYGYFIFFHPLSLHIGTHSHTCSYFWLVSYLLLCTREGKRLWNFIFNSLNLSFEFSRKDLPKKNFMKKIIIFIKSIF